MATERDKKVQELFEIVQTKKKEIAKAEKPKFETNCSFGYNKDSSSRINIQVCADVDELIQALAFLYERKSNFDKAQEFLGTNQSFKWMGFSLKEWSNDIKTRVDKINITNKKKELELLESKLDKLVSPELKAQLELDEIEKMLKS